MAVGVDTSTTVILLLCAVASSIQDQVNRPDNNGKEFIFSFLTPNSESLTTEFVLFGSALPRELFSQTNVQVRVSDASFTDSQALTSYSQMANFSAGSIMMPTENTRTSKGIILTSSHEIFVYGLSLQLCSTDGFLALPTDVLTGNYTIIAPEDTDSSGKAAEIGITAVLDNTQVHIYSASRSLVRSVTLDRGQTFEYTAQVLDISGYTVQADKKVAVMAGRKCLNMPSSSSACDHVVEMLPPMERLGQNFILAPLQHNCAPGRSCVSFFKITAAYDSTRVTVHDSNGHANTYSLNAGQFRNIRPESHVVTYLSSTQPLLAAVFAGGQGYTGLSGDPFFSLITPIEAYGSEYNAISCLPQYDTTSQYFNIEIQTRQINGLKIGNTKAVHMPTFSCTAVPSVTYSACSFRVPCESSAYSAPMFILLSHDDPSVTFSLLAYGYARYDSYGYIGGTRMPGNACDPTPDSNPPDGIDNDCDNRIDEEIRNFIDDDGDNLIDEDLASSIPVIAAEDMNKSICTYASPFADPASVGGYNVTVSYRCNNHLNLTYVDQITTTGVCSFQLTRALHLIDGCGNIADDAHQNIHFSEMFNQTHDVYQFPASQTFHDWDQAIAYIDQGNAPSVISQSCTGSNEPVDVSQTVQQSKNGSTALFQNSWDIQFCDEHHTIGLQKIYVTNDATINPAPLDPIPTYPGCINTPVSLSIPTSNFPVVGPNITYFCMVNGSHQSAADLNAFGLLSCNNIPVQSDPVVLSITAGFTFGSNTVMAAGNVLLTINGCAHACGEDQGRGQCYNCQCSCNGNWTGDYCNHVGPPPNPVRTPCSGHGNVSCSCSHGYTGQFCETLINFCNETLGQFQNSNVSLGSVCETHGTCVSTPLGAYCVCSNGFQGSFCDSTVPGEKWVSSRCAIRNTTETHLPPCPENERCIADNLDCMWDPRCQHTQGWCVPFSGARSLNTRLRELDSQSHSAGSLSVSTMNLAAVNRSVCHDRGDPVCHCDFAYTGTDCDSVVDFCHENISALNGGSSMESMCGPHGTCISSVNGASCMCSHGWTGQLCDQTVPNESSISIRCCLHVSDRVCQGIPTTCPTGQRCLADNLDCGFQTCSDSIGWCVPIGQETCNATQPSGPPMFLR